MPPRATRPDKTCKNCPEQRRQQAQATATYVVTISTEGEAARLWKHVLVGTGTCVGLIQQYASLKMPGAPRKDIQSLITRLNETLDLLDRPQLETPRHEADHADHAEEQRPPAGPVDRN